VIFEEKVLDGARYIDLVAIDGNTRILYEFKSVKTLPPTKFGEQFTKDLRNASSLDEIKWVFDSTKATAGELSAKKNSLLNQIEKSLGALNSQQLGELGAKYGNSKTVAEVRDFISNDFDDVFMMH